MIAMGPMAVLFEVAVSFEVIDQGLTERGLSQTNGGNRVYRSHFRYPLNSGSARMTFIQV
jgi:hypothetical protein